MWNNPINNITHNMNLKNIAVIVVAVLSFTACDDTTDSIGFSLIDEADRLVVSDASYNVYTESYVPGAVLTRNNECIIGKVKDPETGTYITGDMMVQFIPLRGYELPEFDMMISKDDDGNVIADSCYIGLFYSSAYGDTLAPMKVTAYEMTKPMEEGVNYMTDFDPFENGYVSRDNYNVGRTYTLNSSVNMIKIPLNKSYTKDGVTYNNYGTYLLRQYYDNRESYETFYKFLHNICPGFYVENSSGLSNMANIYVSELYMYFRYNEIVEDSEGNDSIASYTGYTRIDGTEEVLQTNKIINDTDKIAELAADGSCTYVKAPAGIFTEVTLPVEEIMSGHEQDSLNTAKMVLQRLNNQDNEYNFDVPSYLMIIQKDSLDAFFERGDLVDYETTFLASYNESSSGSTRNAYTFNNISGLITEMYKNKGKSENWNKAIVLPIKVFTSTYSSYSSEVITKMTHELSLSSSKLVRGTEENPIKISVVYSRFEH